MIPAGDTNNFWGISGGVLKIRGKYRREMRGGGELLRGGLMILNENLFLLNGVMKKLVILYRAGEIEIGK